MSHSAPHPPYQYPSPPKDFPALEKAWKELMTTLEKKDTITLYKAAGERAPNNYVVTSVTGAFVRTINPVSVSTVTDLANVVATLIYDLKRRGIIQ